MNKDNTEQEMAEWKEICHKLHLRDETVDGTDEQAMIRNHYLKWFTPKTNNKDNTVEEIILNICKRDGYSDAEANDVLAVFYSEPAIVEALITYGEQVRREGQLSVMKQTTLGWEVDIIQLDGTVCTWRLIEKKETLSDKSV